MRHAFGLSFCKFGMSAHIGKANVGCELRRCYWTAITGRSAIWRERAQEIFQGTFVRIASLATRRISALGCLQLAVAAMHFVAEAGLRGQVHMRGYRCLNVEGEGLSSRPRIMRTCRLHVAQAAWLNAPFGCFGLGKKHGTKAAT